MSEVLIRETKMKEGHWKILVDQERKLVKSIVFGKCEDQEFEAWGNLCISELKKFNKGESFWLIDGLNFEMKFWSMGLMMQSKRQVDFAAVHCKKAACVLQSFILRKAFEIFTKDNIRTFASVQDAEQWLFKA